MARRVLPILLLAALGCRGSEVNFVPLVEIAAVGEGAALSDDGELAQVSMLGSTCAVDVVDGLILGDTPLPGGDQVVRDRFGRWTVVTSDEGVHLLDGPTGALDHSLSWTDLVDARWSLDGLLGLTADCHVVGEDGRDDTVADCPGDPELLSTRGGGRAWVLGAGSLQPTDGGDPVPADVATFDERAELLLVGHGSRLTAYDEGDEAWSTDLGGSITDIVRIWEHTGVRLGSGTLVAVDLDDGSVRGTSPEALPGGRLVDSTDGLSVVRLDDGFLSSFRLYLGSVPPAELREAPVQVFD